LTATFQGNLGVETGVIPATVPEKPLAVNGTYSAQAGCSSPHPINSVQDQKYSKTMIPTKDNHSMAISFLNKLMDSQEKGHRSCHANSIMLMPVN